MADKYITVINGHEETVEGTVVGGTSSQAGDIPALDNTGRLSLTLMPVGITPDTYSGVAFENLNSASPFVYIRSDGQVANASANMGGGECIGFVLNNYASGEVALVYFEGRVTGLSGLTVGSRYYLSDTLAGGITSTPIDINDSNNVGKKHQFIGKAITPTTLSFEADDYVLIG